MQDLWRITDIRKSKYNSQKCEYDGIIFDSKMEMEYYRDYVIPRIESGEIVKCDRQVRYELQPSFNYNGKRERAIEYVSDFDLTYSDGSFVVVDVKGMVKPMDNLKRKMFEYRYPDIKLEWIGKSLIDGGWVTLDVIKQGRKERRKVRC